MTHAEAAAILRRMNDPNSHFLFDREREALELAVGVLEPKPEMTLGDAVKVLNKARYDGSKKWGPDIDEDEDVPIDEHALITDFKSERSLLRREAILIAQDILNQKGGA